jgi:hypothetical protein
LADNRELAPLRAWVGKAVSVVMRPRGTQQP